ncbi:MAG: flagellar hook-associated protein 3 [Deltaproteobacteria bacterium]|nr:MAG: flagellar hook-associated protein 3 [Deltaproteobacteria bacterium]
MRVTNRMTADLISREIYRTQQLLLKAQVKVATGKKINRPSDDPIGMGKLLDYRKIISSVDQWQENITHGKSRLKMTSTVLDQVDTLLKQAKEWAMKFATGSDTTTDSALIEVKNLYDAIMNLANTRLGNDYIFSGHRTHTVPFSRDENYNAAYAGDDGDIHIITGETNRVKINATGRDTFDVGATGGGTDIFGALKELIDAMEAHDPTAAQAVVADLQDAIDQVQNVSTQTSISYNQMVSVDDFLKKYKSNIEDMLGETENADPARAIVEMQLLETTYTACLETASRVIQPSLVDFLR